ncbi:hypothetical protein CCR97_22840 [Rhodoplanes elegans]|uniref:DUF2232 domain-containing protein n=1 Tax=Rhodoplanes elegans TaxID=29408 RepID=A0A327K8I2_9BRAD|nr:DUF2232 domain-containing protein [Rhodoplanes elegans]MBK5961018.1 hypothetical protein [Rhodoplanes elegans]RAI34264.1 hypothetical protein CH338_21140 [Rhodoplanes elegans]
MIQFILVGLGAGAVAALTFAALAAGSTLSMLLFYLAPLPIMIAALGWSHWAGLLATLVGTAALAAWFGSLFFLVFLLGLALPGWWLSYLALLARPGGDPANPTLDWYPVGRIVLWAAVLGALSVMMALPTFGSDLDEIRTTLRDGFARVFRGRNGEPGLPGVSDSDAIFTFLAIALPPAAASLMTTTLLFNLWLAGRAVGLSGRLPRPWPALSEISFPLISAVAFAAAIAASLLPGLTGLLAGIVAATLSIAFTALGFSVLHALSRRVKSRAVVLTALYAAVMMFGWPLFLVMLVGLVDTAIDLRTRFAGRAAPTAGGPPAGRPPPD